MRRAAIIHGEGAPEKAPSSLTFLHDRALPGSHAARNRRVDQDFARDLQSRRIIFPAYRGYGRTDRNVPFGRPQPPETDAGEDLHPTNRFV